MIFKAKSTRPTVTNKTRSSADADNALDANEAVPNKLRHTYLSTYGT